MGGEAANQGVPQLERNVHFGGEADIAIQRPGGPHIRNGLQRTVSTREYTAGTQKSLELLRKLRQKLIFSHQAFVISLGLRQLFA